MAQRLRLPNPRADGAGRLGLPLGERACARSVPNFALQASAVYRLEVGAACFAVFYLAAIAFMLALDGRGFAEFSTKGLRATKVVRAAAEQEVAMSSVVEVLREQEERLAILEEER